MGREDPEYLVVGHLNKPHGTKGELFVWPLTDHPEGVFVPGTDVQLGGTEATSPDPDLPPLRIRQARPFRNGYLVSFRGVDDRDASERLRGLYLFRETESLEPLAEGEVFYHQLLGMTVETVDGREVGEVVEVYELRPADMLEVRGSGGEVMIPFLKGLVVEVDVERGRLLIDPPEGLLELG